MATMAWQGRAGQGGAGLGRETSWQQRLGMAWRGGAGLGRARQGDFMATKAWRG